MTNKFNKDRQLQRRPKICGPDPPPPPPPPTATVDIEPDPAITNVMLPFPLKASALDTALDPMTQVELSIESGQAFNWNAATIFNDGELTDVELQNMETPGTFNVVTRFSFEGAGFVDHPHVLEVEPF